MDWITEVLNLRPLFDTRMRTFKDRTELYKKVKTKRDPNLAHDDYLDYLLERMIDAGHNVYNVFGKYKKFLDVEDVLRIGGLDKFDEAESLWWEMVGKLCYTKSQGRF